MIYSILILSLTFEQLSPSPPVPRESAKPAVCDFVIIHVFRSLSGCHKLLDLTNVTSPLFIHTFCIFSVHRDGLFSCGEARLSVSFCKVQVCTWFNGERGARFLLHLNKCSHTAFYNTLCIGEVKKRKLTVMNLGQHFLKCQGNLGMFHLDSRYTVLLLLCLPPSLQKIGLRYFKLSSPNLFS